MQNNKQEAYVALSSDQTTLTFYYDNQRKLRKEKTWDINEKQKFLFFFKGVNLVWKNVKTITKMVFDASFKDYTPTNIKDWFNNCKTLKTIEGLQFLNTSQVEDMSEMFWDCHALTSLDLSGFDTSQVKDMSNMFGACHELSSLNLSGFDTSNVTNMSGMFWVCASLKSLDLSHFDTSKVVNMNNMFVVCDFSTIDVSHFNTSKVTDMSGMFMGCSSLTEIDFSHFDTAKVTDMSYMFCCCSALTSLDVSHFDTSQVDGMSGLFEGCYSLTTIYSNSSWSCKNSDSMFADCTSLKGAVAYDESKTDARMANPERGYFSRK